MDISAHLEAQKQALMMQKLKTSVSLHSDEPSTDSVSLSPEKRAEEEKKLRMLLGKRTFFAYRRTQTPEMACEYYSFARRSLA